MEKLVKVPNVTEWEEKSWFSTGGTRAKKIIENPAGGLYYFKLSQQKPPSEEKPGKYFRFEFWSEIIAYKIGKMLGFDVLEYLPAIDGVQVGCLCADMINSGKEEFIGGIQYLQGALPSFNPNLNEERKKYTFQLIEKSLLKYELGHFLPYIIEMILFDAFIGNSDRHQENWAVISSANEDTRRVQMLLKRIKEIDSFIDFNHKNEQYKSLKKQIAAEQEKLRELRLPTGQNIFSPLFDNGSSLGRELEEKRVQSMLQNPVQLVKYLANGKSEIHWEGNKLSHFELVNKLLATEHRTQIQAIIKRVQSLFDEKEVEIIVKEIDQYIPTSHSEFKIPNARKQLIIKMITLRFHTLQQLCNEGI